MSADMAGGRGEDREAREGDFHACKKPVTCYRRKAASGTIKVQEESRLWHNQSHHLSFQDKKQSFF